ncbi:right-handed parallel beta-helix repeat-containing protein [Mammaliicoccus sp. A-M4]|uniref:right-handed parallel beta-helix repeat-containing protein n=1 Tax=Mammaliicoccus sp. A-M4 TaxID=2898664 RepID=UPI001EFC2095|nr:right-handed parallel beta-helix repeat-containing protein [Mammaliicoccus sp. A-M4]
MRIKLNFPIELGQKFRRLIIDNYRLISQKFDYLDSYLKKHRTEEKKAHKSSQIDHDGNSLDREIKQMQGEFDNVIITNNGDGIAEVTQAQVDMVGTRHEVLAKRLRADFLNLERQVDETNKELEKSKVIRSAYDFDVYPDQDIDSSKGLQDWLDWNNHRGGGTIILPYGEYLIEKQLTIYRNTTILGYGAKIIRSGDNRGWLTNLPDGELPYKYEGEGNIKICGLTFDGNHELTTNMNGVLLAHGENIVFEDCLFKNVAGTHAIDLSGCKDVLIKQCSFKGQRDAVDGNKEAIQVSIASKDGIGEQYSSSFDSTPSVNVVVENCYFGPSEEFGGWATAIGDHFSVYDKWVSNVRISNNFIEGTTDYALRVYKFKNTTLSGNIINNCNGGIFATPTPGGYLSSHNAEGVQTGEAQSGEDLKLINNTITNIQTNGIHVSAYPNKIDEETNESFSFVDIKDNTIRNCQRVGIYVPESDRVKITGNSVDKVNVGIQSYGTWQLLVSNNIVSNTNTIGIFVSNNKKLESGSVQNHATITGNQVYNTGQDGIRVSEGAIYIKVDNNDISNYGLDATQSWIIAGIYYVDVHNGSITNNILNNAAKNFIDAVRVSEESTDIQVWNIQPGNGTITVLSKDKNYYGFRDIDGNIIRYDGGVK